MFIMTNIVSQNRSILRIKQLLAVYLDNNGSGSNDNSTTNKTARTRVTASTIAYEKVRYVISHVKELLRLMDNQIDDQRLRLAGREGKEPLRSITSKDNDTSWIFDLFGKKSKNALRFRDANITFPWRQETIKLRALPDLPVGGPIDDTTNFLTTATSSLASLEEIHQRAELNVEYCEVAVAGIIDTIIESEDSYLKILKDVFGKVIERMSSAGELNSLGEELVHRIKTIWLWISLLSINVIKEKAGKYRNALDNMELLNPDLATIFSEYNTYFKENEGKTLLDTVEKFHKFKFRPKTDPAVVETLIKNIGKALIAPANRMHGELKFGAFLTFVNIAIIKEFPDYRRSDIEAIMNSISEYEIKRSNAVFIRQTGYNSDVTELIQYLINKHAKILRHFIDYMNKDNRENRQHQITDRDLSSFTKEYRRQKKMQIRSRITKSSESYFQSTKQYATPWSRESLRMKLLLYPQGRQGYSTASTVSRWTKRTKSFISTIDNRYNYNHQIKYSTTRTLPLKYRLRPSKTVLQKIDSDTIYSDPETYLKKKLHDAFHNRRNIRVTNFRKQYQQRHKMLK